MKIIGGVVCCAPRAAKQGRSKRGSLRDRILQMFNFKGLSKGGDRPSSKRFY